MLSIGKLAPGQAAYYLSTVADGVEDYYTGAGEAPGEWLGSAAAALGLGGEVDADDLHAVLEGRMPDGVVLRDRQVSIPGFDLCFRAPKSVSLLYGLGSAEVSNEVRNAHDTAVRAAVGWLEETSCVVRRGHAGAEKKAAGGFVAAAFRHRSSRAGDPHLHTHVLVANLARGPDGRWSALHSPLLYGNGKTAGSLYEAQLRFELTRRLGVEWTQPRNCIADVAGIPKRTLRAFSQRRIEIEAHLAAHGAHSPKAAEIAALETRSAKDYGVDAESLLDSWHRRGAELGINAETIDGLMGRVPEWQTPSPAQLFDQLASPDGLTEHASTFDNRGVIQGICNQLPAGAPVDAVIDLAGGFIDSDRAVAVGPRPGNRDAAAPRWTTGELLNIERKLVLKGLRRRGDGTAVVSAATVADVLAAHPGLSQEQRAMVERVLGSGDGVEVVRGRPGSGKTAALAAARDGWETAGYRVIGCSLAARAAVELEAGSGIPSFTLDRLLLDIDGAGGLAPDTIVVADEAGMIGTRKLARLLDHANTADAKVLLVGDDHQLPEIHAGGAFGALSQFLDAGELVANHRQQHGWERRALDALRRGANNTAVALYEHHGRIIDDVTDPRDRLVDDWWDARSGGQGVLMVASRRSDVDDLNERARARLVAAGIVHGPELDIDGRTFGAGDEVMTTRNDRLVGVLNGTRGTIISVDPNARSMVMRRADGAILSVPASYLEGGHLTHGYATTIHKAQGATVDRSLVLADDGLSREGAYVGLSRGRDTNHLYISGPDADEHHSRPTPTSDDVLGSALGRSGRQHLAAQHTLNRPAGPTMAELDRERRRLDAILAAGPPDPRPQLASLEYQRANLQTQLTAVRDGIARYEAKLGTHGMVDRVLHRSERKITERELDGLQQRAGDLTGQLRQLDRQETGLSNILRTRLEWERDHGADFERRADVGSALQARAIALGTWAERAQPLHVLTELGPVPDNEHERDAWRNAAAAIETYRERWNITAPSAIDHQPDPHDPRWLDWSNARDATTQLRNLTVGRSIDTPERGLELGW